MASIQEIASVLRSVATPGMKPKALRAAIKERYPDATRKEIVRAAFYALTEVSSADGSATADLHNFALAERIPEDDAGVVLEVGKPKKKKRNRDAHDRSLTH